MSDKRKVSTDALETLGTIIGPNEKRDAIHLAVIPVEAAQTLEPGSHVILKQDGKAYLAPRGEGIGIVDPFLSSAMTHVNIGQHFWLVIYPRVITSLRHVWTHPQLPDEPGVSATPDATASEAWLRAWCEGCREIDYDDLIEVSKHGSVPSTEDWRIENYGGLRWSTQYGYLQSHGSDAHGEIPGEVWDHVRNVIGQEPKLRAEHFSCGC
jgi:hypothetical protein